MTTTAEHTNAPEGVQRVAGGWRSKSPLWTSEPGVKREFSDGKAGPGAALADAIAWKEGRPVRGRFEGVDLTRLRQRKLSLQRRVRSRTSPRFELSIPASSSVNQKAWMAIFLGTAGTVSQERIDSAVATLNARWDAYHDALHWNPGAKPHDFDFTDIVIEDAPAQDQLQLQDVLAWTGKGQSVGYSPASIVDPSRSEFFNPEVDEEAHQLDEEAAREKGRLVMAGLRHEQWLATLDDATRAALAKGAFVNPVRKARKGRTDFLPEGVVRLDAGWLATFVDLGACDLDLFEDAPDLERFYPDSQSGIRASLKKALHWASTGTDLPKADAAVGRIDTRIQSPRLVVYRVPSTRHGHTVLRYELHFLPSWGPRRMPRMKVSIGTLAQMTQDSLDAGLHTLKVRWVVYLAALEKSPDLKPTELEIDHLVVRAGPPQQRIKLQDVVDWTGKGLDVVFEIPGK